jgi:hypothetical protein
MALLELALNTVEVGRVEVVAVVAGGDDKLAHTPLLDTARIFGRLLLILDGRHSSKPGNNLRIVLAGEGEGREKARRV